MTHWLTTLFQAFGKPFQWWVVVAVWEQGVRVRLGKVATLLEPGLHLRIPFLDRVYVQSVRRRTIIETNQTTTTKDGRTVTFSLATDFHVCDAKKLLNTLTSPEVTIGSQATAAATKFIAANDRDHVTPDAIASAATAGVQMSQCGIAEVSSSVMTLSEAKAYRLLNTEYRTGAGLYNLDKEDSGLR